MKSLDIIGCSHAWALAGLPESGSYHIGPVLAHSLSREKTTNKGREKLFKVLSLLDPNNSEVVLAFGEIDIRAHVTNQATQQKVSPMRVLTVLSYEYFNVIKEVRAKGFKVYIWCVTHTHLLPTDVSRVPATDSLEVRRKYTTFFNESMKKLCKQEKNIIFVDMAEEFKSTNYLYDKIHLHPNAKERIFKRFKELGIDWNKEREDYLKNINNSFNNVSYLTQEHALMPILPIKKIKKLTEAINKEGTHNGEINVINIVK